MKKIVSALTVLAVAFLSFVGVAHAADAADPSGDGSGLLDLAKPVIDAVLRGEPWLAASLALVFMVALVGKYGPKFPGRLGRWMGKLDGSDAGRAALVLIGSFGGALGAALTGGAAMSLALAWTAMKVAIGASGVYSLAKKLLTPLVGKAPAWMQPLLRLILWAFDRKGQDAAEAATKADAAGAAAVKANPSTGAAGVVGAPRDVK